MREKTLEPNPDNGSLEEFDSAIKCARKEKEYVRLRAIRSLLLGIDRETVSLIFNVSDRSIQFWIHRFNESGIDGLFAKSRSGRPRSIPLEEMKEKITPVLENPEQENETHWTAKKLHSFLKKSFKVGLCYSTTLNYLHELDYKLKVPQRWPGKEDKEKKALFKRDLSELMKSPDAHFWFCDESGFEGDPRPTRRWAKRGSKPKLKYYGNHLRRSVIGAVCPQNGELFALIIDGCDTVVFQGFLDEMFKSVKPKAHEKHYIILDNASWHHSKKINWHGFIPKFLPPYSPDLNPIERLWLRVKADYFYDFVSQKGKDLEDRLCEALRSFILDKDKTAAICSITK